MYNERLLLMQNIEKKKEKGKKKGCKVKILQMNLFLRHIAIFSIQYRTALV